MIGGDGIRSVLIAKTRNGVETRNLFSHRRTANLELRRAFCCRDEILARSAAERTPVWIVAHHIKTAYRADILFLLHSQSRSHYSY